MELPEWYSELAADEAKLDGRIIEQSDRIRERASLAGAACNHFDSVSYTPDAGCDECWDRIYEPRHYCPVCGLSHRAVCPSGPGVADILSAPTPESVFHPDYLTKRHDDTRERANVWELCEEDEES